MIQAAVPDIVCPAVTAEKPLAPLNEELFHLVHLFQGGFAVFFSFQKRNDFSRTVTGTGAFIHLFFPFNQRLFQLRTGNFDSGVNIGGKKFTFRFFSYEHTESVFCIIFKEGRRPCGTLPFFIFCVTAGRRTAAPYGRAAVSIGNHHAITVKLCNNLTIRSFGTACAGARKFK